MKTERKYFDFKRFPSAQYEKANRQRLTELALTYVKHYQPEWEGCASAVISLTFRPDLAYKTNVNFKERSSGIQLHLERRIHCKRNDNYSFTLGMRFDDDFEVLATEDIYVNWLAESVKSSRLLASLFQGVFTRFPNEHVMHQSAPLDKVEYGLEAFLERDRVQRIKDNA